MKKVTALKIISLKNILVQPKNLYVNTNQDPYYENYKYYVILYLE